MVCNSCLRSVIAQVGVFSRTRVQFCNVGRSLHVGQHLSCTRNCGLSRTLSLKMMVDSGSTANRGPLVDMLPEKEDDGVYVSVGWKSEDGKLSCGYSSFRGKRATMEDFYDIRNATIDGKAVYTFGVFDGHGGSRAADYLKEHLFENLLKHPQFVTDTKLAISETYQQTDLDFLDSEKDTFRDDGSTASTAVLVGNHLFVANVGDSRTVISKAGKGTWRVGGVLAMSRSFGNRMLKQFVIAEPEMQDAVSLARAEDEPEEAARKLTEAGCFHPWQC